MPVSRLPPHSGASSGSFYSVRFATKNARQNVEAEETIDCPQPSAEGGGADPLLLQALLARFALVQVLGRDAQGDWTVLRQAGPLVAHRAAAPVRLQAQLPTLFAWAPDAYRARLVGALNTAADSGAMWSGLIPSSADEAQPQGLRVEIAPGPADRSLQVCTVLVQEAGAQERLLTELRDQREHWRLVALAAELGSVRWYLDRDFVHLDAEAATQFGVAAPDGVGMPSEAWLAGLANEDQLRVRTLLQQGPPADENESITVRTLAARPKVLELTFRSAPDGRTLVGASRDVTREHSLDVLRQQKLAAERASQAKSDFMSQVSHELRTPLNAILGFAELMLLDAADPLSTAQSERLAVLQQSGQRLLGLIDQLLQTARIEQGKMALRRKSVHVYALVQRCVVAMEVLAAQRGIAIEVDAGDATDMHVRADPDALEQVITNLLSNAIKYNRDQGRVRVRLRSREDGELTVDDTGEGMSDSQLGRLFEPFNRLSASKTRVQGTGLGLVITRKLVEAMGGRLDVWSHVGKGSRFKVHLPLGRRVRQRDTQTLPLDLPSRWNSGTRYGVLYIEDDEVNVVLMEQLFATQPDWDLECAGSGVAGLTAALRSNPQLILLDMNLPDMSGTEVLRKLRGHPRTRGIPCVAVSADAMPGAVRRALSLGFDDYWTKPLELSSVVAKIKKLLREELS